MNSFQKKYQTDCSDVVIKGQKFRFLAPKTIDKLIDPVDPMRNFPLWSKIWQASLILADYMAQLPVDSSKKFLEIGCGIGLVGIVATRMGHDLTMTEYDPHALNFACANARINNCSTLKIKRLNWHKPQLGEQFDGTMGSEVIYQKQDFPSLLGLFKRCLKMEGEVILVEEMRKTDLEFYKIMEPFFDIRAYKKILRSEDEETRVLLIKMVFKKNKRYPDPS
jgi:predicted nicotinamide N-methyase